jgi:hypothetical protein
MKRILPDYNVITPNIAHQDAPDVQTMYRGLYSKTRSRTNNETKVNQANQANPSGNEHNPNPHAGRQRLKYREIGIVRKCTERDSRL